MPLEIIHGPESYALENYSCEDVACPVHRPQTKRPAPPLTDDDSIPEARGGYSDVYSSKHEKLLLRLDHIDRMDAIRRTFNKNRLHESKAPLTTSDIVNACLDFVFEQRVPFHELKDSSELAGLIGNQVYRHAVYRWQQFNERF